jgi:hypothetical protein
MQKFQDETRKTEEPTPAAGMPPVVAFLYLRNFAFSPRGREKREDRETEKIAAAWKRASTSGSQDENCQIGYRRNRPVGAP